MLCNPIEILWSVKNKNEARFARFFSRPRSLHMWLPSSASLRKVIWQKKDNGYSERKDDIIQKLRRIARSSTEADMNQEIKDLGSF